MQAIKIAFLLATLPGCAVTNLQCGTDGESSFVNLQSTPQTISQNTRQMAALCSFAYDQETQQ